ncbi:MAG: hypothetical protein J7L96_05195, partial [Bacteroidales bacterium]|nr:hypothetical protein [Bacteroidales bacterium]
MKKLNLFLAVIVGIILASCQQDLPVTDSHAKQDVVFNIGLGEKGLKGGSIDCVSEADYALAKLKDIPEPLKLDIVRVNGELFSATIKLAPGSYILEEFFLMKQGDPDDILVSATPHAGSTYGELIVNPVSIPFEVTAFGKVEVSVDVICYDEAEFESFGFMWFKVNVVHIHEGLFFGDHCSEEYGDYAGSIYGDNPKYDMAAIFKVDLWLNDDDNPDYEVHFGTFNNFEDEDGNPIYVADMNGSSVPPLSVTYIDRPDVADNYMLVISVYQKNGDVFEYMPGNPWYFTDDISELTQPDPTTGSTVTITPGDDGIYDFISGPCIVSEFDFNIDEPDPDPFVCDECEGGLIMLKLRNDGPTASIIVKDDKEVYFEATVVHDETFEFNGTKSDGKFEKNTLEIYVDGTLNTTIH